MAQRLAIAPVSPVYQPGDLPVVEAHASEREESMDDDIVDLAMRAASLGQIVGPEDEAFDLSGGGAVEDPFFAHTPPRLSCVHALVSPWSGFDESLTDVAP